MLNRQHPKRQDSPNSRPTSITEENPQLKDRVVAPDFNFIAALGWVRNAPCNTTKTHLPCFCFFRQLSIRFVRSPFCFFDARILTQTGAREAEDGGIQEEENAK